MNHIIQLHLVLVIHIPEYKFTKMMTKEELNSKIRPHKIYISQEN